MTSPFPALHTQANEDVVARTEAARVLTEQVAAFLAELDALLAPQAEPIG